MRKLIVALALLVTMTGSAQVLDRASRESTPVAIPLGGPAVFVTDTNAWTTTLRATAPNEPLDMDATNCVIGPPPKIVIPEGGAAIIRNFGTWVCGLSDGFGIFTLPEEAANANLRTQLTFNDGASQSAFVVPHLEAFGHEAGDRATALGITNDAKDKTYVVIYSKPRNTFTLIIRDTKTDETSVEYIGDDNYIGNSNVAFYPIVAEVEAGSVEIVEGHLTIGPNHDSLAYGFVSVGPPGGGSQDVIALVPPAEPDPVAVAMTGGIYMPVPKDWLATKWGDRAPDFIAPGADYKIVTVPVRQ